MLPVGILEWRSGGHRLAYVAAIVDGASAMGYTAVLVTDAATIESPQFEVHLRGKQRLAVQQVRGGIGTLFGMVRSLGWLRKNAAVVVVPEVDRFLAVLIVAWLFRTLPKKTAIIVMRPPMRRLKADHSSPSNLVTRGAALAAGAFKTVLMVACQHIPSISLFLLEDPLASGNQRVWGWPFRSAKLRLDDPSDLLPVGMGVQPEELRAIREGSPVIAIAGSIDSRKQVPLVLEAWDLVDKQAEPILLLAGPHEPSLRLLVGQYAATHASVISIDRYLTNDELAGVIERSEALVVLYDGGVSSGILTSAVAAGRWVITTEGTRLGAIAAASGIAVPCTSEPASLASAIERAVSYGSPPSGRTLPTGVDFALRLLSRH